MLLLVFEIAFVPGSIVEDFSAVQFLIILVDSFEDVLVLGHKRSCGSISHLLAIFHANEEATLVVGILQAFVV